jgi:hypothetical protein
MPFDLTKIVGNVTVTMPGITLLKGDTGATGGVSPTGQGIKTIDFGSTPTDEASLVVTGLTDMTATTNIIVFMQDDDSTADNTADDHKALNYFAKCSASSRVAGVGFTINIRLLAGYAKGTYKVHYIFVV